VRRGIGLSPYFFLSPHFLSFLLTSFTSFPYFHTLYLITGGGWGDFGIF